VRTRASVNGHSIHPALVHFPIALLSGAFLFDAAATILGQRALWTTGAYLSAAGIASALLAAIPGLIDYFWSVPPASSAKRRATLHMAANITATAMFAAGWLLRGNVDARPTATLLVLEGIGVLLLSLGGYTGSVLVERNQIGIDHRYAEAGKWIEKRLEPDSSGEIRVTDAGDLGIDQMMLLHVAGHRLVLARTKEAYVAFDDRCPHRGGSLAGGVMICGTVQCPWHGSQFDVRTGGVRAGPARSSIATYPVAADGSDLIIRNTGRGTSVLVS
jgi:uncharacterized membrane protein/nitrite reductase/ring-hydroxylating ferredoxin subunit